MFMEERGRAQAAGRRASWMLGAAVTVGAVALALGLKTIVGPWTGEAAAQAPKPAATAPKGPAQPAGPQPGTSPALKDVARVNNYLIKRGELGEECLPRHGAEVLDSLINRKVLAQNCRRLNIVITEKEVSEEIDRIAKRWQLPVDQYLKFLKDERDITPEQYARHIVWPSLALRRLAREQIQVTPQEVQVAFETEFGPSVRVRQIVVDSAEIAQKVHARAVADPAQFPKLAIEVSQDYDSASAGGLLRPIRRHVGFAEIEKQAFALPPGQISPPFQVGKKWVILKCEQQIPARAVAFKDAEAALVEAIKTAKLRYTAESEFETLKKNSAIRTMFAHQDFAQQFPTLAAIVNDEQITRDELIDECITMHGKEVLEGMIGRRLLEEAVQKHNIPITQADIDQETGHTAIMMGFEQRGSIRVPDLEALKKHVLEDQKTTWDLYVRDVIWPTIALRKLTAGMIQVTAEDIQKGYEANYGEQIECLAIVCNNQRRAREAWELARKNLTQENFADLAEKYSTDPAVQGLRGTIPPIHRHSGAPLLEEEAFRLQAGEISSVVQVDFNFVILFCIRRTQPVASTADDNLVRKMIYEDVFEKKQRVAMAEIYEKIREVATIDNYLVGTVQRGAAPGLPGGAGKAPGGLQAGGPQPGAPRTAAPGIAPRSR